MLTISKEQIRVFEIARFPAFEKQMVEHICFHFHPFADIAGKSGLPPLIKKGFEKAQQYGLITSYEICLFIDLMIMIGHEFDSDPQYPWALEILTKKNSIPSEQIDVLYKYAVDYLSKVNGKGNSVPVVQFEKLLNNKIDSLIQLTDENLESAIRIHLENFFPEKFNLLKKDELISLTSSGISKAEKYGFNQEITVAYFITLMFLFGHGFDTDFHFPWIVEVLNNPQYDEETYKANSIHFIVQKIIESELAVELPATSEN